MLIRGESGALLKVNNILVSAPSLKRIGVASYMSYHRKETMQISHWSIAMINFENHVKHLRFYGDELYGYHHHEVEKRFYEAQELLGSPVDSDLIAFVTLRFKGKSDWVVANAALNSYEHRLNWSLSDGFRESNDISYVTSIESSMTRLKDHSHVIVRLTGPLAQHPEFELEDLFKYEAYSLDEVNHRNADSVKVRIFPFCGNSYQLGNHLEYICKTSSKHYNPLARKFFQVNPKLLIKTQL